MTQYVNCHNHSEASLLDGYSSVTNIVTLSKSDNQPAAVVTDHGSLAGWLKLYKAGKEHDQKVIYGVEAYVTQDITKKNKESSTWHSILLAKSQQGIENLLSISQIGWEQGFYSKPRIDKRVLNEFNEGIICLSGCMASEASRAISENDMDKALNVLKSYRLLFGDDFYVELQPGNELSLNQNLAQLAADLQIKPVVTIDSHFDECHNRPYEELLLLLQQFPSMKQSLKDYAADLAPRLRKDMSLLDRINELWPNRGLRYDGLDLYMQPASELHANMAAQFSESYATLLMDNTLEIADKCEPIEFKLGGSYLPKVIPTQDSDQTLRELCNDGLNRKDLADNSEYQERLEDELGLITAKGFSDYFLLCWDIINFCRNNNIYVGPGRGSAAGSLVAYSLGITSMDPIKYKLLFFRFLRGPEIKYDPAFTELGIQGIT